jgi:hypothetical protein
MRGLARRTRPMTIGNGFFQDFLSGWEIRHLKVGAPSPPSPLRWQGGATVRKVLWQILAPRSWGTEPVVRCWCAGIAAYLFCENCAMAECINGLGACKMLRPLVSIPLSPPLSVGAD